jgi:elongation factor P
MLSASELRAGHIVEIDGNTYMVLKYHHNKTGRGGAVIKVKIKNIHNGAITEYTCRPGDKYKQPSLENRKAVYQYNDGEMYYFMENDTFEQVSINADNLEYEKQFLIENEEVFITYLESKPLNIQLPQNVVLKIVETEPVVKGSTVTAQLKPAILETGLKINVPGFVEEGTKIKVDTRTEEYIERV